MNPELPRRVSQDHNFWGAVIVDPEGAAERVGFTLDDEDRAFLRMRQAAADLLHRWRFDAAFRDELRRDPYGAVDRAGVQLTEDERAYLDRIDWNLTDDELRAKLGNVYIWDGVPPGRQQSA